MYINGIFLWTISICRGPAIYNLSDITSKIHTTVFETFSVKKKCIILSSYACLLSTYISDFTFLIALLYQLLPPNWKLNMDIECPPFCRLIFYKMAITKLHVDLDSCLLSFLEPIWSIASVDPTSEILTVAILLLLVVE